MERDMKELLIEYAGGKLSGELEEYVRTQIEKNEAYRKEYEELKQVHETYSTLDVKVPSDRMQQRFDRFLQEEMKSENLGTKPFPTILKIAAALILIAVFTYLGWFFANYQNDGKIQKLESEMALTKQAVMDLMLQSSASTRIQGVNSSSEIQADDEIVSALIFTLNFDQNTNVRLAALNALARFSDEELVREELIKALKFQDNATIQISLINLLVDIREKKALDSFKELLDSDETEDFVKEEAQLGIFKLS